MTAHDLSSVAECQVIFAHSFSHDVFNERSGTVIGVALTSQEPRVGFPLTLESKAAGLTKRLDNHWRVGSIRVFGGPSVKAAAKAPKTSS
jgi:hypothetical protein